MLVETSRLRSAVERKETNQIKVYHLPITIKIFVVLNDSSALL